MINADDWAIAERIARFSKTHRTPQDVIAAFEDLMQQVDADDSDE